MVVVQKQLLKCLFVNHVSCEMYLLQGGSSRAQKTENWEVFRRSYRGHSELLGFRHDFVFIRRILSKGCGWKARTVRRLWTMCKNQQDRSIFPNLESAARSSSQVQTLHVGFSIIQCHVGSNRTNRDTSSRPEGKRHRGRRILRQPDHEAVRGVADRILEKTGGRGKGLNRTRDLQKSVSTKSLEASRSWFTGGRPTYKAKQGYRQK